VRGGGIRAAWQRWAGLGPVGPAGAAASFSPSQHSPWLVVSVAAGVAYEGREIHVYTGSAVILSSRTRTELEQLVLHVVVVVLLV
jgi:hypothetical protein